MRSGVAIVEMFERKFGELIPPLRRQFLIELIEAGMQEAYETAKKDFFRLGKQLAAGEGRKCEK